MNKAKGSRAGRPAWQLLLFVLLSVALLSSCGFRPRGEVAQLAETGRIFVDAARDSDIGSDLREALSDRAFTVVDIRDQAEILLRVNNEQQSQRIVSVQSTGKVSELELSHSVSMQIAQSVDGNPPRYASDQSSNRVEVIRQYTYDRDDVLGKENEARILRREMRSDLILQIVLRTVATLASSVAS